MPQSVRRISYQQGWYDDTAAAGLVNCIQDFDPRVRLKAIEWAILTTEERFEELFRRVVADFNGSGSNPWTKRIKKRGLSALAIASRVRDGESVAQIRVSIPEEDSFTFDHLRVFEPHYARRQKQRRKGQSPPGDA